MCRAHQRRLVPPLRQSLRRLEASVFRAPTAPEKARCPFGREGSYWAACARRRRGLPAGSAQFASDRTPRAKPRKKWLELAEQGRDAPWQEQPDRKNPWEGNTTKSARGSLLDSVPRLGNDLDRNFRFQNFCWSGYTAPPLPAIVFRRSVACPTEFSSRLFSTTRHGRRIPLP